MDIDAVITWVDGGDPKLRDKLLKYGTPKELEAEDVAGSTRYSNLGEIFYCVASLNRFAPWLHRIYIVTDNQDPNLLPFLERHFPDGYIPMEIVDHKIIYRGYEEYLPTFNSISIETMTWRIPGLSEYYIEFNDDLVLASPVSPEDFFLPNGQSVCYANHYSMHWTRLTRLLKPNINGRRKVTFKGNMYNAALMMNRRFLFLKLAHTPKALRKSCYEQYFSNFPDSLIRNITHRFRHSEQFTSQELQYLFLQDRSGLEVRSVRGKLFFLQPKARKGYVSRKMNRLRHMPQCKFCCFNSLDKATSEEYKQIIQWMEERLDVSVGSVVADGQ